MHIGQRQADCAEELMRARYSAYRVGELGYVWQTWHPRTRPAEVVAEAGLVWTGLEVVDVAAGQPGDETGEVEFRAHYGKGPRTGTLHERSRFAVRAGRWFYVDGQRFD